MSADDQVGSGGAWYDGEMRLNVKATGGRRGAAFVRAAKGAQGRAVKQVEAGFYSTQQDAYPGTDSDDQRLASVAAIHDLGFGGNQETAFFREAINRVKADMPRATRAGLETRKMAMTDAGAHALGERAVDEIEESVERNGLVDTGKLKGGARYTLKR